MDEQLSEHFFLREFLVSQTAARMGIEIKPTPQEIANLRRLCVTVLEPIRIALGRPMVISSGLRPLWLNEAVGGSKTSAHIDGRAADLLAVGMSTRSFARFVKNQALPVDQVLDEFSQWCHVSVPVDGEKPRRQYLIATHKGGGTVYQEGL